MTHIVEARAAGPNLSSTTLELIEESYDVEEDIPGEENAITINNPKYIEYIGVGFYLSGFLNADQWPYQPHSSFDASSTNVQLGLNELVRKFPYKQDTPPVGAVEGATWYDGDDNAYKLYLETSPGTLEWVTLAGTLQNSMTSVNGGTF